MDRPTETIKLPNGVDVVMHTYLTVREKRDILSEANITRESQSAAAAIVLQDAILKRLMVTQIDGLDDMPSEVGDVLYEYAIRIFTGKNV